MRGVSSYDEASAFGAPTAVADVDLDVDLKSSTTQALDWMATHQLIVPGTLLYYDDWHASGPGGVRYAHHKILRKKFGMEMRRIGTDADFAGAKVRMFEMVTVPPPPTNKEVTVNNMAAPGPRSRAKTWSWMGWG